MSSISKNLNHYRRCVSLAPRRRLNSGSSNSLDASKLQVKSIILRQWKLISGLKTYLSKLTKDQTFDNVLNREFAVFLQKIDAKTYGKNLSKYFSTEMVPVPKEKGKESPNSFSSVLNSLTIGNGNEEEKKDKVPQWKVANSRISNEVLNTTTHNIVRSLTVLETDTERLKQVEILISHLKEFPEKHTAVKAGAIRNLLMFREKTSDLTLQEAISEGLAILGYIDPVKENGIRILSIDGGGVRGILVIEMLKKLEELSGKPLYEMFDFICGVSTGAIIASLLGLGHKTLDEITNIYTTISAQIFTQSPLKGTKNFVWSHSYYDTALWEEILKGQWKNQLLIETRRNLKVPKYCAISAVVNQSCLSAYIFRNYALPCRVQSQYTGSYKHKIWESVRASAAAPTYFEEFKIGNMLHQDGGILANNPTAVAIHEAKLLWPTTPVQCIISCGTGRKPPNPLDVSGAPSKQVSNSSWAKKLFALIHSATDTEGVHTTLSDLLPDVYFRFNPYLTEMLAMSEIRPEKLNQLKRDALMYLRRNEDKFQEAANALSAKKKLKQKVLHWVNIRREIFGFEIK